MQKKKCFNPLEATLDNIVTWVIKKSQKSAAPAQVQFELQAIKTWRLQAGKSLGHIPFETSFAKGLFNLLDPSQNGILGFELYQLQAMLWRAVTEKKSCNFANLRQIAIYVLQYWGTSKFIKVQDLKMDQLVNEGSHFELVI